MQTTTKLIRAAAAVILVLPLAAGCGGSGKNGGVAGTQKASSTLVGAGSTLVAPLVARWQSRYAEAHGVSVTYGAIGSGGGIEQMTVRTVDFGASDAPLTPDQATS